jgi:hypothetical protein
MGRPHDQVRRDSGIRGACVLRGQCFLPCRRRGHKFTHKFSIQIVCMSWMRGRSRPHRLSRCRYLHLRQCTALRAALPLWSSHPILRKNTLTRWLKNSIPLISVGPMPSSATCGWMMTRRPETTRARCPYMTTWMTGSQILHMSSRLRYSALHHGTAFNLPKRRHSASTRPLRQAQV